MGGALEQRYLQQPDLGLPMPLQMRQCRSASSALATLGTFKGSCICVGVSQDGCVHHK